MTIVAGGHASPPACLSVTILYLLAHIMRVQMHMHINQHNVFTFIYRVGQKTGLFLRSDNFATTSDSKACNLSKVIEFCLE